MMSALVAAAIATEIAIPRGKIWIPPRPAIVRAESLELSRHILAMPLSMGFLSRRSVAARTVTYKTSQAFTTLATSFTITNAPLGTASSDRLVVVVLTGSNSTSITGCTLGGSAMTLAVNNASGVQKTYIYYLLSTSGTAANVVASTGGGTTRVAIGVYTIILGTTSATPSDTKYSNNTSQTSLTLPSVTVPAGGVYVAGFSTTNAAAAMTITGATEDYDLAMTAGTGGAGAHGSTTGAVAVAASGVSSNWGGAIAVW